MNKPRNLESKLKNDLFNSKIYDEIRFLLSADQIYILHTRLMYKVWFIHYPIHTKVISKTFDLIKKL
jgi:hypothetical protein